jgi:hypothetical protein
MARTVVVVSAVLGISFNTSSVEEEELGEKNGCAGPQSATALVDAMKLM